jgi:hypothetical protein
MVAAPGHGQGHDEGRQRDDGCGHGDAADHDSGAGWPEAPSTVALMSTTVSSLA